MRFSLYFCLGVASIVIGATLSGCAPMKRSDGGMGLLPEGSPVPNLKAVDHLGKTIALRKLDRPFAVIYFYPKDATPGCTKEACAFRDAWSKLQTAGVTVIGVSSDSLASHKQFAEDHQLPFSLIADEELQWAKAFGVPSTAGFLSRVSFLINSQGVVARVYPDVDPGIHATQIIEDVAGEQEAASAQGEAK